MTSRTFPENIIAGTMRKKVSVEAAADTVGQAGMDRGGLPAIPGKAAGRETENTVVTTMPVARVKVWRAMKHVASQVREAFLLMAGEDISAEETIREEEIARIVVHGKRTAPRRLETNSAAGFRSAEPAMMKDFSKRTRD